MKRTYFLGALVLICVAYILKGKRPFARDDLASAKAMIENVARQPVARSDRDAAQRTIGAASRASVSPQAPSGGAGDPSWRSAAATRDDEKVVHLTKGTFTVVDGTIVYGSDAQLDIGHGMLVSSPSGVMVSDVDQRHIAGDLVIDTEEGTTTTENAFLSVDNAHVEMTSDSAVTVKKDAPK
jgi:hypothetical protein